jgi:hypothetical protein
MEPLERRELMSVVLPGNANPVPLHGTSVSARPELAGTVIYDHVTPITVGDANGTVIIHGTLHEQVVRETSHGSLDFYESIHTDNASNPFAQLSRVTRSSYVGFGTDVDFSTDLGGNSAIHPTAALRSSSPGAVVAFNFSNESIGRNQTSRTYFVRTNATQFDLNGFSTITAHTGPGALNGANGSAGVHTPEPHFQPIVVNGSITGTVTAVNQLATGPQRVTPLAGATVFIDSNLDGLLDGNEIHTVTDQAGQYTLSLAPGTYLVRLQPTADAASPFAGQAHSVVVHSGQVVSGVNFSEVVL